MRASRLCISLICTTPVKPASRSPSSRMAARIGLSSTMTIFGDDSALIDQLITRPGIHSTEDRPTKPCNYGQLGLAAAEGAPETRHRVHGAGEAHRSLRR